MLHAMSKGSAMRPRPACLCHETQGGENLSLSRNAEEEFTRGAREGVLFWPVRGFPATQRETRGSPALCVSGSFQGNQRVFGAPFCFSRVSLGKLASFPESESWSGAKSGAKIEEIGTIPRYFPGIPGFSRYTRKIPGILPILAPKQPQTRLRAPKNDEFHGVSPGIPEETRGCCRETSRKHGKETR